MIPILTLALFASTGTAMPPTRAVVDADRGEVRLAATVQPHAMQRPFGVRGHHAVVWQEGRSKRWALFVTPVSDHEVRLALDSLGARRGENLTPATWNERGNRASREPDRRVEGTPIDVFVEWNGHRVALASLLEEKGRHTPLLDLRYGGNERWQSGFRSGCIVCLYSCPGGAIGNHAHTIRDSVRDGVVYASVPGRLPAGGTTVMIILKPRLEIP